MVVSIPPNTVTDHLRWSTEHTWQNDNICNYFFSNLHFLDIRTCLWSKISLFYLWSVRILLRSLLKALCNTSRWSKNRPEPKLYIWPLKLLQSTAMKTTPNSKYNDVWKSQMISIKICFFPIEISIYCHADALKQFCYLFFCEIFRLWLKKQIPIHHFNTNNNDKVRTKMKSSNKSGHRDRGSLTSVTTQYWLSPSIRTRLRRTKCFGKLSAC